MDSKLIHIKAQRLLSKGDLDQLPNGGWQYCGRSDDLKVSLLAQAIERQFADDNNVYFIFSRHDSRLEPKADLIDLITSNIDERNFTLWSENFCKVMEFNSIGVYRFGVVCG